MVHVINQDGTNGEPCSNKIARLLIKEKKAIIQGYKPFTIRLTFNLDEVYEKILESENSEVSSDTQNGGDE